MRGWLINLLELFIAHTGLPERVVVSRVCGAKPTLLESLKLGESSFSSHSFDWALSGLSDVWPDDLPWPEGVPRFSRSQVRIRSHAPKKPTQANAAE
ncbi:hypothetical protein HED54_05825 [Ochrobactrum anthropi ATCC 49188]|nr:hypothetical protein [Brucella anthropi ATCC 49188]